MASLLNVPGPRVVDMRTIREACAEIAARFRPLKIVLFGSHAHGNATAGSDVDLLVIMRFTGNPHEQSLAIRAHLNRDGARFPMDILARTPEAVAWRLANGDSFLKEVLEHGVVMYEAADA